MFAAGLFTVALLTRPVSNTPVQSSKPLAFNQSTVAELAPPALTTQLADKINTMVEQPIIPAIQPELSRQLPSSLVDSAPPALVVDKYGNLAINRKIMDLFDFYLSALGEEKLEIIVNRIKYELQQQLINPALEQGLTILSGYLLYLNEITQFKYQHQQHSTGDYLIENVIDARYAVLAARRSFLAQDVILAFWDQQDQYEDYMLKRALIGSNINLSPVEKQQAIAEQTAQAPSWLVEQQYRANQLNDYRSQYSQLQQQGATDQQLSEIAYQEFEPAAAQRLNDLTEQRQLWQQRLNDYRIELQYIISISSDTEQTQQLTNLLRQQHFSNTEVKRVRALDTRYLQNNEP